MIAAFRSMDRLTRIGVIAVAVLYLILAISQAITMRIEGGSDARAHLDYMYQLWHGHLPDGFGYEIVTSVTPNPDKEHLTASHPPLYYVLMLPFVAPFFAVGDWQGATVVTRIINIGFGLGVVAVLSWAAWRLGGAAKRTLAIAVPALAMLMVPFMRVAGDSYNDVLAALLSTIALAAAMIMLREGPTLRLQLAIAISAVLGVAVRATGAGTLGVVLVAILVAHLIFDTDRPVRVRLRTAALWWAGILGTVAVTIGWFFVLNQQRSGSWWRSRPQTQTQRRERQSVVDVLTNPDYYLVIPNKMLGFRGWENYGEINLIVSPILTGVCALGVIIWLVRGQRWRRILTDRRKLAIAVMSIGMMGALAVMQLVQANGWGNINPRYFLPGMIITGFLLAIGALAWPTRGLVAVAVMAVLAIGGILEVRDFDYRHRVQPDALISLGTGILAGVVLLVIAVVLWKLTSRSRNTPELAG